MSKTNYHFGMACFVLLRNVYRLDLGGKRGFKKMSPKHLSKTLQITIINFENLLA